MFLVVLGNQIIKITHPMAAMIAPPAAILHLLRFQNAYFFIFVA